MDRYTIGQKVFRLLLELLVAIHEVQFMKHGVEKRAALEKISPTLDTVKILIRLTLTLEIIEEKQYLQMQNDLRKIGQGLGGWINSLPTSKQNS